MHDASLHLFIDDHHIRNIQAINRIFNHPKKHFCPVLEDIPGRFVTWASVMQENNGFRIWYQSVCKEPVHMLATAGVWGRGKEFGFFPERYPDGVAMPETQTSVVSYAQSNDGVHWEKPVLGLFDWRGNRGNNIVLDGSRAAKQFNNALTNMDTISVLRDNDESNPEERYKLICHWETIHLWDNIVSKLDRDEEYIEKLRASKAKYLTTSPDGIHWDNPLVRIKNCACGGDYAGVTRDERNGKYWFNDRAHTGVKLGHRTAGLCSSSDLYKWPDTVEMVFAPGEYEDYGARYQHHGMVPFNYGDQDLCFLEYSIKGCPVMSILGTHRDGERWQRANGNVPFLSIGPHGSFDDSIVAFTRNSPFRVDDKLLFFYNGRSIPSNNCIEEAFLSAHIGLAVLRLDGFACLSVDRAASFRLGVPGELMTMPIEVKENGLEINISGHEGTARVGLFYENMQAVPGFEPESCLPIDEDAVRAPVRWKSKPAVSELKGQRIHVLVRMNAGKLYSIHL